MATYRAIASVCQAISDLLENQYRLDEFKGSPMQFRVIQANDLDEPPAAGVTVFLHRVAPNGAARTAPRKGTAPVMPLTLGFILTAWGKDAGQQQRMLGWAIETLNNHPVLDAGLLNAVKGTVFGPEETVEVTPDDLNEETMLRLWKRISPHGYQVSVAYTASVRIGG